MKQIRIHGRGGQGVVTAAELIALAGFYNQQITQALPAFGVERTGAPVQAFARLSDQPIRTREHIYEPDVIIIQDDTLLDAIDVLFGATPKTLIIINTKNTNEQILNTIKKSKKQSFIPHLKNIYPTDASQVALEIFGKNLLNTTMLGSFASATKLLSLEVLQQAIQEKFAKKGEEVIKKNILAITRAYQN